MRKLAELLARDYRAQHYVRLVALGGLPFALTRDGSIVTVAPIDALSWTPENAARFATFTAARRAISAKSKGEIKITGTATALAKRDLKKEGWGVVERLPY